MPTPIQSRFWVLEPVTVQSFTNSAKILPPDCLLQIALHAGHGRDDGLMLQYANRSMRSFRNSADSEEIARRATRVLLSL